MNVMKATCGTCAGIGKYDNWKLADVDDCTCTMKREEVVCEVCNGMGYTEYAVLSVEEVKAIMKHCGLSTES